MRIRFEVRGEAARFDLALLRALQSRYPSLSRATLKEWFRAGRVRLEGQGPAPVASPAPSLELAPGEYSAEIADWNESETRAPEARPSQRGCFLPVVYEDEDVLVLHKTSGVPSVPHASDETETAVGAALARVPALGSIGRAGLETSVLHRLDTGTSGLLAFAKSQPEFERLRAAWKSGEVRKTYRALARPSEGAGPLEAGTRIELPLAHDARSEKRMVALSGDPSRDRKLQIRGKPLPARTRIERARGLPSGLHDVEIVIETGVMHQIRCHLAALSWPIQGDPVYRGTPSRRLWLHAWKLELPLANGVRLRLQAELPEGWPRLS